MCVSEPKHYLETLKIGEKRDARTGGGDAFRAVSFFSILVNAYFSRTYYYEKRVFFAYLYV